MGAHDRTPMAAVIVEVGPRRQGGGGPDDGQATTIDAVIDYFGGEKWDLVLDVTAPNGERFRHAGRYKIANRLGGLRRAHKRWRPEAGLAVPVLVSSDRRTVEIDWDRFVDAGGIEQAVTLGDARHVERGAEQGAAAMGKMLAKNPKMAAKQRAQALQLASGMALEVTTGVRPAHEFASWISGLVQGGALSTAEGDDYLRQAGLR